MLENLADDDKLRLLRFLCSFAWADLNVGVPERKLVVDLIRRFGLRAEDAAMAAGWLDHPPNEDDIDPTDIPREHRQLVLDAVLEMVGVDGRVDSMEAESYAVLEALMTSLDEGEVPA